MSTKNYKVPKDHLDFKDRQDFEARLEVKAHEDLMV
jgi:hypothetical protein